MKRVARKCQQAGHFARQDAGRGATKVVRWRTRQTKSRVGRPQRRGADDIREIAGNNG